MHDWCMENESIGRGRVGDCHDRGFDRCTKEREHEGSIRVEAMMIGKRERKGCCRVYGY